MGAFKIFRRLSELLDIGTADLPALNQPLSNRLAQVDAATIDAKFRISDLPEFNDDDAAISAGFDNGDPYRSNGLIRYVNDTLQENTLFWLSGEEPSGDMVDSSSNGRNFTAINNPGTDTQDAFTGRRFIEANAQRFELNSNQPDLSGTWHIAAHIRIDDVAGDYKPILSLGGVPSNQRGIFFNVSNTGKLRLHVSSDGTNSNQTVLDSNEGMPTERWIFVEAYHDAELGELGVSFNGGLYKTTTHAGGIFSPALKDVFVGFQQFSVPEYMRGIIRHIGVFNRRLRPSERQILFNAGAPTSYPLW